MTTDKRSNPDFYDADSTTYDQQRWESASGRFTNAAQQRILADLCSDWKDKTVLECGPGTARFTIPLAKRGNTMTLLDISRGMLDVAKGNLEKEGVGDQVADYVEGSIYELPFEDNTFDHAICLNVFNHLDRAGDALAQLARVIKSGSTLLFNYANLRSYYYPAAKKINARSTAVGQDVYSIWERPADVMAMIDAAGLTLDKRAGHVHVPRAMEKYKLLPVVKVLDGISRSGPLAGLASVHFMRCRKK